MLLGMFLWHQARPLLFPRGPDRVAFREDGEQRRKEVMEAFGRQQPLDAAEIAHGLKPLFEGLGDALRAQAQERLLAHFDMDRMFDELVAQEVLPRQMLRDRTDFVRGLREGMGRSLRQQAPVLEWTDSEIRNVKKLQGNEAVVIVRHRTRDGGSLKMRWWVTKRQGTWKVFDMEDLDVGIRLTITVGTIAEAGPGRAPEIARAMNAVRDAMLAVIVRQDPDTAERRLRQVAGVKLPPKLEGLRFLVTSIVCLHRGQFQEALDALDKAHGFNADMPCLDLFKGLALNRLDRWEQALRHLEAYRNLLGDDAVVCRELGVALAGLRRFPEACAAYRKALDLDPKDADSFLALLRALEPGSKRDDMGARFARLDNPHQNFDACAEDRARDLDGEGLEQLALAMRKIDPHYGPVDYYLALVRVWADRADQAVPLFQTALAREKDPGQRETYLQGFLQAMANSGKTLEAYAAAPDAGEAFRFLAARLQQTYQPLDLKRLVAAHAKKHPDDPLLPFYRAEVYVQQGQYQKAEEAFAAGMAKPPDEARLALFRHSRVLARYHTGRAQAAYADIGPKEETLQQLAALAFHDENDSLLQALLDAHARTDPDNAEVLRYRYRLKVRKGQLAEGIALFKAALAKQAAAEKREDLAFDFLLAMSEAGKPLEGYQAAPDAKQAFQFLAGELLDSERWDDLRKLIEAHRRRQPADVWLSYYTAELHRHEGAWDKAARVLGAGLKKAPDDHRVQFRSNHVFFMYKAGRGLQAYQDTDARPETFNQLANLLIADKKGADLEALVEAHRAHVGDDPDLLRYEARAKTLLKQPAQAIPLFQEAYHKQSHEAARKHWAAQFLEDMEEAGAGLEGYRAVPDRAYAFQTLAGRLVSQKKAKELELLLAEHGKDHAGDPWHHFYSGELHLLRDKVPEADGDFKAALAKASSRNQGTFRNALFRARVRAGKAAEAYQEFGPGTRTFEGLAQVCLDGKNATQLEALLAAHRKAQPDDPIFPAWDLEVRWLNQDYEGALKVLDEHRHDLFAQPMYRWKADSYRVRGLVKLKKTEEAVREAEAVAKKSLNQVLLILAHAAHGGARPAIAALEKLPPRRYLVENCYHDPDLGPILRSEPFREFRERFPEPGEKRGAER